MVSKLQYHNYEEGEYSNKAERNFDESIKLIESFPWQNERLKTKVISLTNPSITFEKNDGSYLKLATSFNQKYVLSYYSNKRVLYNKYIFSIKDSFSIISSFFNDQIFDLSSFRKQNDILQNYTNHFENKNFVYTVSYKKAFLFLVKKALPYFLFGVFIIFCAQRNQLGIFDYLLLTISLAIIGGGVQIFVFLNFWLYAKNKILIFSKGKDIFYFGNKHNPVAFCKKDILNYSSNYARKGPLSGFNFLRIEFNDYSILKIPNLFLHYLDWENKLYNCEKVDDYHFPYCN